MIYRIVSSVLDQETNDRQLMHYAVDEAIALGAKGAITIYIKE